MNNLPGVVTQLRLDRQLNPRLLDHKSNIQSTAPSRHSKTEPLLIIMAALCNRADHYIFALWFLSSIFYLFFIPRLISAAADWMSTIL